MTDEEYVFKQTEKERKRLGRGAFNKINGSRSKKCTMPSEYLTKGERKKLNGEEKSYSLNEKYSWKEFMELPTEIQQMYEQNLVDKHAARMVDVADYLGTRAGNLANWNGRHGIKVKWMGHRSQSAAWRRFIDVSIVAKDDAPAPVEEPKEPEAAISSVKQEDILRLTNGEVFMTGLPEAVFEKMLMLLGGGKQYCFRIGFFEPVEKTSEN